MAIAQDAVSNSWLTSGTLTATLSHTCSWTNRLLVVATINNNLTPTDVTWVTYNGLAMTNIGWRKDTGVLANIYFWYLLNPPTWANDIVATKSSTFLGIVIKAVSFTWVAQWWQPDSSAISWPTTTTSFAPSTTTVANNCLSILVGAGSAWKALTAWANTTITNAIELLLWWLFIARTTTTKTPAWVDTITITSLSQNYAWIMASFAPASYTTWIWTIQGISTITM